VAVFLVAVEESGDRLGAALMQALRQAAGGRGAAFMGVGGRAMTAAGLDERKRVDGLGFMGVVQIPRRLLEIRRHIRETADAVIAAQPDVLVIIDSPDFTHRVARRVRALAPALPIVDYVCPSVWAWRPWRARAMRGYVDHVLALLPFEPQAMVRLRGPPCSYVGHPMPNTPARWRRARRTCAAATQRRPLSWCCLEPPGEIRRLLDPFATAIELVAERHGAIDVVMPTVPHLHDSVRVGTAGWSGPPASSSMLRSIGLPSAVRARQWPPQGP
jgi:lipid-A-disaccharide synthase